MKHFIMINSRPSFNKKTLKLTESIYRTILNESQLESYVNFLHPDFRKSALEVVKRFIDDENFHTLKTDLGEVIKIKHYLEIRKRISINYIEEESEFEND